MWWALSRARAGGVGLPSTQDQAPGHRRRANITLNTLKSHLASIYRKLGVTDRDDAATRATETGLL